MTERIEIHLKYEGPDVENGTMSIQDVIPVLQGFSGAYSKLAETEKFDITHRIYLSAVKQGSADIVLEVLTDNKELIGAVAGLVTIGGGVASAAFLIIKKIFEVIRIKKHVGVDAFTKQISVENGIAITNSNNVQINVLPSSFERYKEGKINKDLDNLTKPLQKNKINAADFEARANNGESLSERITVEDRPYFEIEETVVTTTKDTELIVTLNSLTKSTNSGYLFLTSGKRVFYRYLGDDESKLHSIFGNYSRPVNIQCKAKLDGQLEIVSIDILHIERLQQELFGEAPNPTAK